MIRSPYHFRVISDQVTVKDKPLDAQGHKQDKTAHEHKAKLYGATGHFTLIEVLVRVHLHVGIEVCNAVQT